MRSAAKFAAGIGCLVAVMLALAAPSQAQADGQVASPPAKAECKFADGKTIHIDYASPRMRGRKIFGGLVPYGEPWRTGANEATTFVIDADVNVGGKTVPAGSYTLFTLPKEDGWTLIVSKDTGEWGIPYPGEQDDFTRTPMKVSKLDAPLENFTISLDRAGDACTLRMDWETTRASVGITEKK
ncbi:MAG: DUF2911 domain-containing protein [Candidatus Acidiferrales bacterium]